MRVPGGNVLGLSGESRFHQEEQKALAQIFKKPKMDPNPDEKDNTTLGEGCRSSASWNVNSGQVREVVSKAANDLAEVEEVVSVSGDCSTCGHIGFPAELFVCVKCETRRQHTYCSNSYHPRRRWFLRLCNWCEAESTELSNDGAPKKNQRVSKRDTWSGGRPERSNAVECLLGAALRLPAAGFSCVEDLLQVDVNASSAKRRKPPSFDSVEKARRSGPGGDVHTVKSVKRSGSMSLVKMESGPRSTSEFQKSPNSSVDNGGGRSPSIGSTPWRMKRTSAAGSDSLAVSPTSSVTLSARDIRAQRLEIRNRAEQRDSDTCVGIASSSDSSDKHDRNGNFSATHVLPSEGERANTRLSPNASRGPIPFTKSPAASTAGKTSAGFASPENDVKMKHASGEGPMEHVHRATRTGSHPRSDLKENISKNSKLSGTSRSQENGCSTNGLEHKQTRLENPDKQKQSTPRVSLKKSAGNDALSGGGEDIASPRKCVGLRSDSISVLLEQQHQRAHKSPASSKDSSASPRKGSHHGAIGTGSKQYTLQQASPPACQTPQPSIIAGRTTGSSPTLRSSGSVEEKSQSKRATNQKDSSGSVEEKSQSKRATNQKDSSGKAHRTSTKLPGFHNNYKSLSDILC